MNFELEKYLNNLFDSNNVYVSKQETFIKIPSAYSNMYQFYNGKIFQEECLFVKERYYDAEDFFNEDSISKHMQLIRKKIDRHVIYVTSNISNKLRIQLINNKISFIAPFKQTFLPFLYFESRDDSSENVLKNVIKKLSPATQQILFFSLYRYIENRDEIIPRNEIIDTLEISKMTFSRAMNELIELKVVNKSGYTRNLKYYFYGLPSEIFEKVKDYCISPIRDIKLLKMSYSNKSLIEKSLKAGEYALSNLTLLNYSNVQIAIYGNDNLMDDLKNADIDEYSTINCELQIWRYDPLPLIKYLSIKTVDPLSLYFSFEKVHDERLANELNIMLEKLFNGAFHNKFKKTTK